MSDQDQNAIGLWRSEFSRRLEAMLRSLLAGSDVPPAERLKAEGFAEAGLVLGLINADELAELLDGIYLRVHGRSVAELFAVGARDCVSAEPPRVVIPLRGKRAPVYTKTPPSA